jgi:hypothetical protein
MNKIFSIIISIIMTTFITNISQSTLTAQPASFKTFKNDPINIREYKLDNGLTFIASINKTNRGYKQ